MSFDYYYLCSFQYLDLFPSSFLHAFQICPPPNPIWFTYIFLLLFQSHFTAYLSSQPFYSFTCFPSLVALQGGSTAGMQYMITSAMHFKQIKHGNKRSLLHSTINPVLVHHFNISYNSFHLRISLWCPPFFPVFSTFKLFMYLFFSLECLCRRFIFWIQSSFHLNLQTAMPPAWISSLCLSLTLLLLRPPLCNNNNTIVTLGFSTPGVSSFSDQPFLKFWVLKIPKIWLIVVGFGNSDHLKAKQKKKK
jgi:hypothetical protein